MLGMRPARASIIEPVQDGLGQGHDSAREANEVSKAKVDFRVGGKIDIEEVDEAFCYVHPRLGSCESIIGSNGLRAIKVIDLGELAKFIGEPRGVQFCT